MDSGIRASIGVGLGAFVLSALVGAFSRIPFGTILFRAFLLGLLFAGIGYGVVLVFRRFLLESEDQQQDSFMVEETQARGNVVDIVLPEGQAADYSALVHGAEDADGEPDEPPAGPSDESPVARQAPSRGNLSSEDLAREVESIRGENVTSRSQQSSEAAPIADSKVSRPSVSMDTLDVLPDLDTLSDSFGEVLSDESGEDSPVKANAPITGSFSSGGSSGGGAGDPAVLAKAVQTLLRKDQKGQ